RAARRSSSAPSIRSTATRRSSRARRRNPSRAISIEPRRRRGTRRWAGLHDLLGSKVRHSIQSQLDHYPERKLPMRPISHSLPLAALALVGTAALADGPSPVRLDPDKLAGIGLTSVPGTAYEDIRVEGELKFRVATLFAGKELNVSVFESTPAKTDHRNRPLDVDEFVYVLSGKLILTEQDGTVHEFTPGQSVVLPRGYDGTWEMQGNYREIAIVIAR